MLHAFLSLFVHTCHWGKRGSVLIHGGVIDNFQYLLISIHIHSQHWPKYLLHKILRIIKCKETRLGWGEAHNVRKACMGITVGFKANMCYITQEEDNCFTIHHHSDVMANIIQ